MRRQLFAALTMMMMTALLTGCWSRHELNDLGITMGVAIDKQGDKYLVSAQMVIPEAIAAQKGETGMPVTMVQASGGSIAEAFRRMTTSASRKPYLSHMRILVISEELAKDGIKNILDFFKRNREVRPDFYVVIAKGSKAHTTLSVIPRLEKVPAQRIFRSLALSEKEWAPTVGVFLDELTTSMATKGKEAVLTGLHVVGDREQGATKQNIEQITDVTINKTSLLGVFKKDKLVGWLSEEESKGYNYAMDNVTRTNGFIPCPDGTGIIGADVLRSKTKMTGFVKDGKPEIEISVRMEASIADVQCAVDLTKKETISQLEQDIEKKIKKIIEQTIRKTQKEFNSDILGFGEVLHRSNPKYWASVQDHWNEEFPKLPVHFKVVAQIRRTGTENNSFIKELEKKE